MFQEVAVVAIVALVLMNRLFFGDVREYVRDCLCDALELLFGRHWQYLLRVSLQGCEVNVVSGSSVHVVNLVVKGIEVLSAEFSARLKEIRTAKGVSQPALANVAQASC
jgi:hypothetical protein